jgi:hypothetical protein
VFYQTGLFIRDITAMLAAYFVRDAFYCLQTIDFSNFGVKFLSRFYWMKKTKFTWSGADFLMISFYQVKRVNAGY